MSCLYVTEQGAKVNVGQGSFIVECKDGSRRMIPQETLESIMILGNTSMTTACMKECMQRGIKVTFLSSNGRYFGRLESTSHTNAMRLKNQVYLSDNFDFTLQFARLIQQAKVQNQLVLLKRYNRIQNIDLQEEYKQMQICRQKMAAVQTIEAIMGYEGIAARMYFQGISKLIEPDFKFQGRNRRPPKDAFNSMISLGYTILFYEIYAELESRSINPYIGFIHKIKEHHPALVSDLLEEWRAVIVDATVLSMIQGHEISIEEFQKDEETGAVLIAKSGIRKFIRKLEQKMMSNMNYLSYLEHPISFRRAIWWQVKNLAKCVDEQSVEYYQPLKIR